MVQGVRQPFSAGLAQTALSLHLSPLCSCDATLFNLSLLTSDAWAVGAALLLFGTPLRPLYWPALACIVAGLVVYNRAPPPVVSSGSGSGGGSGGGSSVAAPAETDFQGGRLLPPLPSGSEEAEWRGEQLPTIELRGGV